MVAKSTYPPKEQLHDTPGIKFLLLTAYRQAVEILKSLNELILF